MSVGEEQSHVEVDEVLEDRDEGAKQELVTALISSIDHLSQLPSLAQKHQIFHAIETIIGHPSIDSSVIISQILPHVFALLKDELPKEEFYAVHILTVISKKCMTSRYALFEMAEHLIAQLKENYQLFHDELNIIVEKYGDVLSLFSDAKENIIVVEKEEEKEEKEGEEAEAEDTINITVPHKSSSSSLLSRLPSLISRSLSTTPSNTPPPPGEDGNFSTSTPPNSRPSSIAVSHSSSSSSLLNLLHLSSGRSRDNLSQLSATPPPPPDLPYDATPDFIKLLRRKTDLHFESLVFLRLLASSSGTDDFDPEHLISDFILNFAEWNNRSKARSSKILQRMVAKCDTQLHVEALQQSDIFLELLESLQGGSFPTKSEAMWLIKVLTKQPLLHDALLASPLLGAMVALLQEEGQGAAEVKREAFWALQECCKDVRLRSAIFQAGGLPGMIRLVKELHIDDPEPLKILSFLTHDETLSPDTDPSHTPPSQQISEENVLTHIVNTLRNGTEEEQLKAQELMITLAQGVSVDHLNCAFAHSDALPLLLEMLRGKHMLKIKALKIIRILSKEHNLRRVIVDSPNGLETLVGMVQTGPEEIKVGAGRVLGLMITDPDTHDDIFMSGLFHVVLSFITHDHGGKGKWDSNQNSYNTKLLAVEVLSLFAATESTKETMSKSQLVPHLKHLMHHETGTLQEHAAELASLMEGEGRLRKIFHHILHRHHDE